MGINLIRNDEQHTVRGLPAPLLSPTTQIRETILLDKRVRHLRGSLVEAGFEVTLLGHDQRTSIPSRQPGSAAHIPILVTACFRDWIMPGESPRMLGASLVNVKPILGHPEGCANVLVRALTEDVPEHSLMWIDFDHSGHRHLVLFVAE